MAVITPIPQGVGCVDVRVVMPAVHGVAPVDQNTEESVDLGAAGGGVCGGAGVWGGVGAGATWGEMAWVMHVDTSTVPCIH